MIFIYEESLSWLAIVYIPLSLIIAFFSTVGLGMLLSALNVKYRDVRYILPFLIQSMMFLSPIIFPVSVTSNYIIKIILKLNPISGALEIMRGIFLNYQIDWQTVLLSLIVSLSMFFIGLVYFRKTESYFADLV